MSRHNSGDHDTDRPVRVTGIFGPSLFSGWSGSAAHCEVKLSGLWVFWSREMLLRVFSLHSVSQSVSPPQSERTQLKLDTRNFSKFNEIGIFPWSFYVCFSNVAFLCLIYCNNICSRCTVKANWIIVVNVMFNVSSPAKHFVSNFNAKLIIITIQIYFRVLAIGI